ncbi:AP2-like ethylene-responsive transcription factor AIL5 [Hibiscus syriacus]|uniref:AP2-like ethylene-responsive transcription factor AIL5 n=1 Tax=Hibiscus syriacus TaxID=106335 RepID=A0A6A2ZGN4_HIBSY|nr:AP2-like ethylene-responsive transcription factor AIL5 [Hibiscus syriacus]
MYMNDYFHGCSNSIIGFPVYLGGYDKEDRTTRAYDLAALKYWGPTTITNFPISNYEKELAEMKSMTRQEGVTRFGVCAHCVLAFWHYQHGRCQARIGRVAGNKDLYLGTFSTQEEAAEAYDIAAIKFRGLNEVTNLDMSHYDVKNIANSNLPIGGLSNKSINCSDSASDSKSTYEDRNHSSVSTSGIAFPIKQDQSNYWSNVLRFSNSANSLSTAKNSCMLHQTSNDRSSFASRSGYNSIYGGDSTGLLNGDGNVEQQQQQEDTVSTNLLPFASLVVVSNDNGDENSSSGYGNC